MENPPTTAEGLDALIARPHGASAWAGPYVRESRLIDGWGRRFVYNFPARIGSAPYDLYSFGRNEADDSGGRDDISNWKGVDPAYYVSDERPNSTAAYILGVAVLALLAALGVALIRRLWKSATRGDA
jgi:hypothetical protein